MNTEKFDAIVIGAGLGGLSAAGYLAKAGKSVLVLEHHTVPGGYAHEFRRGHYRFEVALHALDGAAPGGWAYPTLAELEVLDQVRFERMDPFYTVRFPDKEIVAHADPLEYEGELIRHFPDEADSIRTLIDAMTKVYYDVRRFMVDGELNRRPPMVEMPASYPHMLTAMGESWGEFMGRHISDPQLQGVFTTLWGYYGLPPSELNAATFIFPWVSYHLFGAFYPEGGSMAMSRALEATIRKYGGEVRYRQTVNHIEIRDGKAVAVETEDGLRAEADLIISNANAPDTMLKFVGREHLPADYAAKVEEALARPALSSVVVYLGLDRDLTEEWPYHELFLAEGYDLESAYRTTLAGDFERADLVISCYDHADPGCAPEGGSVLTITALAPWNFADQWGTRGDPAALDKSSPAYYQKNPHYQELKQAVGETLIDRMEKLIPGLRQSIKYVEVATPLTNVRYSRNPGGSIYGSEQAVDNMYTERLSDRTPFPNLFLAGAWVNGGGMSAALLSGRSVARKAQALLDGVDVPDLLSPDIPDEDVQNDDAQSGMVPDAAEASPEAASARSTNGRASTTSSARAAREPLPDLTLTAAGSGRAFSLASLGAPAVLVLHGQDTAAASDQVNQAVRERYPLASDVMVASVVDLRGVPRMFRRFADGAMKKAYQKAAGNLPRDLSPEEYVIILPDWDGSVNKAVGVENVDKHAAVVVLDGEGRVVGVRQGDDLGAAATGLLAAVS